MKFKLVLIIAFVLLAFSLKSQEHEEEEEKLNVGNFIIEHISDSYDWHITQIGKKHISIPLPVILYSKQKHGIVVFMSNKLHNEHHSYLNFHINHDEGMYKGKIMETLSDGTVIRPFDISFTKNALAVIISCVILLWVFTSTAKRYNKNPDKPPKGLQSLLEPLIIFIRDDVAKISIGKKYEKFVPYLLTVFFFIFLNNLLGLIPIFPAGANLTGNVTITMILALFTLATTTFAGNKHYWKHVFWSPVVPWWLKVPIPLMPIIEILGLFIKPFVLMVRLFANIIGGHVVMLAFFGLIFIFGAINAVVGYLVSPLAIIFTIFDTLLELLIAFIQAYVFTLLSAIYFGFAVEEGH